MYVCMYCICIDMYLHMYKSEMFYWSFTSLVHFWPPQFLILATPMVAKHCAATHCPNVRQYLSTKYQYLSILLVPLSLNSMTISVYCLTVSMQYQHWRERHTHKRKRETTSVSCVRYWSAIKNGYNEMQVCATVTGCRAFSGIELSGCLAHPTYRNFYWTAGQRIDLNRNSPFVWRIKSADTKVKQCRRCHTNWYRKQPDNRLHAESYMNLCIFGLR